MCTPTCSRPEPPTPKYCFCIISLVNEKSGVRRTQLLVAVLCKGPAHKGTARAVSPRPPQLSGCHSPACGSPTGGCLVEGHGVGVGTKCVSCLHTCISTCKTRRVYIFYLKHILIQKVASVEVTCASNDLPVSAGVPSTATRRPVFFPGTVHLSKRQTSCKLPHTSHCLIHRRVCVSSVITFLKPNERQVGSLGTVR